MLEKNYFKNGKIIVVEDKVYILESIIYMVFSSRLKWVVLMKS